METKRDIQILLVAALASGAYADKAEWSIFLDAVDGNAMFQDGQFQSGWYGGNPDASKDVVFLGNLSYALGAGTIEMKSLEQRSGFNLKTLTDEDEAAVRNGTFNMAGYTAPDIIIGDGGINFTANDGVVRYGSNGSRYGINSITVGGDFNMAKANWYSFTYNPNAIYGEGNWSMDIGGVVKMNGNLLDGLEAQRFIVHYSGGAADDGRDKPGYTPPVTDAFVRFGGLDGSGYMYSQDPGAGSTSIYFQAQQGKTFQGGDWTGVIAKNYSDASDFNLVMDGGADGGRQYLRLMPPDGAFEASGRPTSFNLEVRSGYIGVSNSSASRFDSVKLNGGTLEVAYSRPGKHDPSQYEMGLIHADRFEINADSQIIFDISGGVNSDYENDIIFSGDISGSGIVTLVIELDADYFAEGQEIDKSFQLFSISDENSYDWALAVVKVMYNGGDISGNFSKIVESSGASVSVALSGAVPEPAAVAAVMGASALAFAAWRRRK